MTHSTHSTSTLSTRVVGCEVKERHSFCVRCVSVQQLFNLFPTEGHLILDFFVSFFGFFLFFVASGFCGFWLLWLLASVASGFCGFWLSWLSWLLWLLAFVAFGFLAYPSICLYLSIYLSIFLSFWQLFSFLFLYLLFLLFALQRRNQTRKQASKQASTSCSPLDLVCCWGRSAPPQPPLRHEICTSSPTPAPATKSIFLGELPGAKLSNQANMPPLSIYLI